QELAAEELQPDDASIGIVGQVLLQEKQIVRQPVPRVAREDRLDLVDRLDHLDARAAAALVGLEQRRPLNLAAVGAQGARVVEGERARSVDAERAKQGGLGAL